MPIDTRVSSLWQLGKLMNWNNMCLLLFVFGLMRVLHLVAFTSNNKLADKTIEDATPYIDIKSVVLRDALRAILKYVRGTSLAEDMPSV